MSEGDEIDGEGKLGERDGGWIQGFETTEKGVFEGLIYLDWITSNAILASSTDPIPQPQNQKSKNRTYCKSFILIK